jgi:flagellar motor switch protein FliM
MPEPVPIAQPDSPGHLAVQAPPDIVAFAERVHQAFLESLQSKLTVAIGADTRASFIRTEQSSLARYLTEEGPGMHSVALSLEPLAGCVLLRFSSELLFTVLDILLASPAAAFGPRGESLTEIEFHVLRGFFRVFSDVLKETWRCSPPVALTLAPESAEESLPAYGDSHSLAMKSTLEIAGATGDFTVVVPAFLARLSATFSGLRPDGATAADASPVATTTRIAEALGSAKVDMEAVLSNLTIRIGDLVELAPGQILLGEKAADSTFECLVNKRSQFRGELVSAGERYGFQLAHAGGDDRETDSTSER